jgi:hypothetical protein
MLFRAIDLHGNDSDEITQSLSHKIPNDKETAEISKKLISNSLQF